MIIVLLRTFTFNLLFILTFHASFALEAIFAGTNESPGSRIDTARPAIVTRSRIAAVT